MQLASVLSLSLLIFARQDPSTICLPIDAAGRADLTALAKDLARQANLTCEIPDIPLRLPVLGLSGAGTRTMLSRLLGDGVSLTTQAGTLQLTIDPHMFNEQNRSAWTKRVSDFAERIRREAQLGRSAYGMRARPSYRPNDPARPTIVLVHGMNSASGCFVHMVPLLEDAGYGILLYDYPDNQDLDTSAPEFAAGWKATRAATGDSSPWIIVAHSMGALLARHYVEGDSYAGDVSSLILIAPPNQGSALAKAQGLFQMIQNMASSSGLGSMLELSEGLGEAANDLVPGSAFLTRLNARPRRAGVRYCTLAGTRGFLTKDARRQLDARLATAGRLAGVLGKLAQVAGQKLNAQLDELTDETGDGAVGLSATALDGVHEYRVLHANHVELIRGPMLYPEPGPVACMPQLLTWLKQDAETRAARK